MAEKHRLIDPSRAPDHGSPMNRVRPALSPPYGHSSAIAR